MLWKLNNESVYLWVVSEFCHVCLCRKHSHKICKTYAVGVLNDSLLEFQEFIGPLNEGTNLWCSKDIVFIVHCRMTNLVSLAKQLSYFKTLFRCF